MSSGIQHFLPAVFTCQSFAASVWMLRMELMRSRICRRCLSFHELETQFFHWECLEGGPLVFTLPENGGLSSSKERALRVQVMVFSCFFTKTEPNQSAGLSVWSHKSDLSQKPRARSIRFLRVWLYRKQFEPETNVIYSAKVLWKHHTIVLLPHHVNDDGGGLTATFNTFVLYEAVWASVKMCVVHIGLVTWPYLCVL